MVYLGNCFSFTFALFNNCNSSGQSQLNRNASNEAKSLVILAVVVAVVFVRVVSVDGLVGWVGDVQW